MQYREDTTVSEEITYEEVLEMERKSVNFKELGEWLDRNKNNKEHLFLNKQVTLMSWGQYTQDDVPRSCFVKDDPRNLGEEAGWF